MTTTDPIGPPPTVPADLVARTDVPTRWPAVTARLAKRLTLDGRLASWTVGRRVFVSAADVERFLAASHRPARV